MFISNSRRFIYIHLYKCAGTSVECALARAQHWNDLLLGSTAPGERMQHIYRRLFGLHKHSSAQEVRQVVGDEVWSSYFTFSTVRNPFARAVSQYTFSLQHYRRSGRVQAAVARAKVMTGRRRPEELRWPFNYPGVQAIQETGGGRARFSDFIRSTRLDGWPGFSCQCDELSDESGRLIVDEAIKLEELAAEWPRLRTRLGLEELPLGAENVSAGGASVADFYADPADREYILNRFRKDFVHFGYSEQL